MYRCGEEEREAANSPFLPLSAKITTNTEEGLTFDVKPIDGGSEAIPNHITK